MLRWFIAASQEQATDDGGLSAKEVQRLQAFVRHIEAAEKAINPILALESTRDVRRVLSGLKQWGLQAMDNPWR